MEGHIHIRNRDDVLAWVDAVRAASADDECAHAEEDRLHQSVLRAIANGHADPASLAAAALKTTDIDFSRWYA
jgi:plasmid stability protein